MSCTLTPPASHSGRFNRNTIEISWSAVAGAFAYRVVITDKTSVQQFFSGDITVKASTCRTQIQRMNTVTRSTVCAMPMKCPLMELLTTWYINDWLYTPVRLFSSD